MSSTVVVDVSRPVAASLPTFSSTFGPFASELVTSGTAVGVATAITNPIDVVKCRLQIAHPEGQRLGFIGTGADLVRTEGVAGLFAGVSPAVSRGVFYGALRLGLYGPIKAGLTSEGQTTTVSQKLAAGCVSGAVAAGLSNPMDLVKTRLQAKGTVFTSSGDVARHIVATEGVLGLWKGSVPGMARAATLTASQCVSYDIIKRQLIATTNAPDTFATHFAASMLTGLVSTTATSPVDVVKTRMYMAGAGFSGPWACAMDVWARDGVAGFFKGWTANYARLGPQTMITFVVVEQLRKWAGMKSM